MEGGFWQRLSQGSEGRLETAEQGLLRRVGMAQPIGEAIWRGGASAWLPIEGNPRVMQAMEENALRREAVLAEGTIKAGRYERWTTPAARKSVRAAGRVFSRWISPVIGAHRLATEVPQAQGFGGKFSKATRIIGEETINTAAIFAGAAIGTALFPGAGTIVGGAVGFGFGLAMGGVGSWAFNEAMDVVEAPIRAANAGWNFMARTGKQGSKLELGGGISAANRTGIAYTMRQRALAQMNRSGINARSLLGNEASMMHIR